MEKSIVKYLAEFTEELESLYGAYGVSLDRFFADADAGKLDIEENYAWLSDFARAIEFIQRLFHNEHIHVKHVKELRQTETASRVDAEAFTMTLKEPKVWRRTENGLRPVSVYNNTYEDDHAIYENRFIKRLIDEIIRYLTDTSSEFTAFLGNIRTYFASGVTTAAALRLGNRADSKTDEDRVLADEKSTVAEHFELVETLLKKAVRLRSSTLYIECAKKPALTGNIYPTNILLKDPVYRECYFFYKKLQKMGGHGRNMRNVLFDNALLKLFNSLHHAGYRPVNPSASLTRSETGRLSCRGVGMINGMFCVYVDVKTKDEFDLSVLMRHNGVGSPTDLGYSARVSVRVTGRTSESMEAAVAEYREKKMAEGYDDAFMFACTRRPTVYDGIVNCANKGDFTNRAVEDFVSSLALLLSGSHKVFAKRCPVCGSKYVEQAGTRYVCGGCGGAWSLVLTEAGEEKVWVKRLRR